jgi:hypothetical protein
VIAVGLVTIATAQEKIVTSKSFYITKSGTRYHRDSCKYLGKSRIRISDSDAKKFYKSCKICKPDSGM